MNRDSEDELRAATQASYWDEKLPTATLEEERKFVEWAEGSASHVRAFLFMPALDADLEPANLLDAPSSDSLLARARSEGLLPSPTSTSTGSSPRPAWRRLALVAGGLFAVAMAAIPYLNTAKKPVADEWLVYTSGATGQSRTLEDGSEIYIEPGSEIRTHFQPDSRNVRLVGGEAIFNVQHVPHRPFRVYVTGGLIQAVGTQFRVRRGLDQTLVNVSEGTVQISGKPDGASSILQVSAGDHATLFLDGRITAGDTSEPDATAAPATVSAEPLIFRGSTLQEVADAYNSRQWRVPHLVVEGGAQSQTLVAIIPATDPELLIRILQHQPQLNLSREGTRIIVRLNDITPATSDRSSSP